MKEIVVISGKGGTGKTSITASFAYLIKDKAVIADCDVDAADMHLLLNPDYEYAEDFYSGELAVINQQKCIKCGKCKQVCRFKAVSFNEFQYDILDLNCEGCGYCSLVCPVNAISMETQNIGKWYRSKIRTGSYMVHAKLGIGTENSGKLVAKVKNQAKKLALSEGKEIILVDGSPGIGCPVVSSLTGATYVVFVTESTTSGLHDLKRVYEVVKKFGLKSGCIINKFDLNSKIGSEIEEFLKENDIDYIAKIPYDESFSKAITAGKTVVEYDNGKLAEVIKDSWKKIIEK